MSYPSFDNYPSQNQDDPYKYSMSQTQNETQFNLTESDYDMIQALSNIQSQPPNSQKQEMEIEVEGEEDQNSEQNLQETSSETTQLILISSESEEYKSDFESQGQDSEDSNPEERLAETENLLEKTDQDPLSRTETVSCSSQNVEPGQSDKVDEEGQKAAAFLFDKMFEELTKLVTDIHQKKGLESLEHEIKVIHTFFKERREIFEGKAPDLTAKIISKTESTQGSEENNTSPSKINESQSASFNLEAEKNFQIESPNSKSDLLSQDNNSPSHWSEKSPEQEPSPQRNSLVFPRKTPEGQKKKQEAKERIKEQEERKINEKKFQDQISQKRVREVTNKPQKEANNVAPLTQSVHNSQKEFESKTNKTLTQSQRSHGTVLYQDNLRPMSSSGTGFGLKNFGNTCYMNALFQCLCHIEEFSNQIMKIKSHDEFPLIKNLAELFNKMKNRHLYRDSTQLDLKHQQLVEMLYNTRPDMFQANAQGDSSILFRVILEELNDGREFNQLPQLQMFASGPLTKEFTCKNCGIIKISQEQMHILEVKDINFLQKNQENFFQPSKEKRHCRCNRAQNDFTCHYLATDLPRVLAIRINDTIDSNIQVRILLRIHLLQSSSSGSPQKKIEYKFVSTVANSGKGRNGFHSVAITRQQDSCYVYDDDQIKREVSPKTLSGHPQLLFYVKSNKE